MDNVKLQVLFQTVIAESNRYIAKNDLHQFKKAVWKAFSKDSAELRAFVDAYYTPGFKSNKEVLLLNKFTSVKELLDKVLEILFEAAILNTPEGYQVMNQKILALHAATLEAHHQ